MNRNKLLVIAVLALVGAGLGIASAQLMAPQPPVEDTVLYSAEAHNNGTDIGMVSIYAASGYGFDNGIEIEIEQSRELTAEERQKAIDIALSDSKVKDLLDGREYEIDYIDCMPSLIGQDTRASVDIYILNASKGDLDYILVLVNLDDKTVVDVIPIVESSREPTAEERQKAIDIALSDSKVKNLLDGREYEIDYVELNGLDTHALVEIDFPNASDGDLWYLSVLVNLDKKTVVEVMPEGMGEFVLPPDKPLTPEEEKRAINIALSDPNVEELLKGREYNVSGACSMPSMPEADRYAFVDIHIQNVSANMSAFMMLDVNLNESIVEYLSFEMFRTDDYWRSMYGDAEWVDCGVNSASAEA